MPTVNEKNQAKRSEGTYGNVQYDDYTSTGLNSYYYSGQWGELRKCIITRDPKLPTHWCIRNTEGNVIAGCSGSFSGTGSGSPSAEKRWKDWCAAEDAKKPIEVIT
jgi:hypothetical protein